MFTRSISSSIYPVYLVPSIPFRQRKESVNSSGSTDSTRSTNTSDRSHETYLGGNSSQIIRCAKCATDICLSQQIISKGFTGRHGRAYLVSPSPPVSTPQSAFIKNPCLPNTKTDAPSSRQLVTGVHTVCDVRCIFCASVLGWKYDAAEEDSQRYKVGKYILETKMICSSSDWESDELQGPSISMQERCTGLGGELAIEFDSQDEDECEELFAGVWSPSLALKKRQRSFSKGAGPGVPSTELVFRQQ